MPSPRSCALFGQMPSAMTTPRLHAVEQLGVQHDLAAPVADLDAVAVGEAECRGIVRMDQQLRPAFSRPSSSASR